jgi:hypothetical protein
MLTGVLGTSSQNVVPELKQIWAESAEIRTKL